MEYSYYGNWYNPSHKTANGVHFMAVDVYMQKILEKHKEEYTLWRQECQSEMFKELNNLKRKVRGHTSMLALIADEHIPLLNKSVKKMNIDLANILDIINMEAL
jgi:hypothetical protein